MTTTLLFTMSVWLLPVRTGQEPQSDWLLVPGERVGPVQANTSEADLQRLFGRANVVPTTFSIGEGEQRPGTIVFPNDSTSSPIPPRTERSPRRCGCGAFGVDGALRTE